MLALVGSATGLPLEVFAKQGVQTAQAGPHIHSKPANQAPESTLVPARSPLQTVNAYAKLRVLPTGGGPL